MADELIPYSDPATGWTPLGSDPGVINESVIPKSRAPDPTPDHVEALRLNPEFSADFDQKFGAGAAARHLAQSPGAPVEAEKPSRYRPALSWSTQDILAANKPENPLVPIANEFVDGQVRKLQATRDGAALTSVEAFMRGPGPKTKADWLDDEIASAEWSVGYWQREMAKTDIGRISYNADYERAQARLEAARKAKADLEDKSERTADAQVQIAIASRIADQKGRVAYAEDQLDAAKDGDLGTGLTVKQYEENLRYERKKLNALESAMEYARQKSPVNGASFTGEVGRSFLRSMMAETPEMLAGAVQQISKSLGPEYGQMASEIAGEVKSIAKGLKQDMPAPKQSEILALDPKSPEFANNLRLYVAHAFGQGVGSTTAFWLAAAAGGAPTAGGMGITLGIGQMRNALEEEFAKEGMRLQDHDVDTIVYMYGTLIGSLDAYGAMFNLNMLGREAKTAAVRHMASAIARGAAKGAIIEGGTEGLQEAIQMIGENYALDRNMDWTKFRDRVIENFAAGSIPGMAFGAKNAHTEQGAARARAEYDKIIKQIEAESLLKPGERPAETQAPTVSTQPETVSAPETERKTGRLLPPVQAEARDPATVPKPEPVSPQPETLSELSKEEKADIVEAGKAAGIAKEGETPEQTLQRMREKRAEGQSFGKYDEVFDRLDAVEVEAEQQRAKDATVQPEDVESIVDMWRFTEEAAKVKDPEGLIDFLRRSGGISDFGGDIRSTLGEARMRPGLVSNNGLALDAATRLAWDNGFLNSAERPDINALIDAINEDHAGNRVVRGTDRATLDDLKIARDMADELRQFGIKKGMTENEVRDTLKGITREGGSGTQDGAANNRGPQSRTIGQVFQAEALNAYLERGGQTDVESWPQLADALGIEFKDVPAALDAAVADGTLRKHDGRYWRNRDVFADDIPFALAGERAAARQSRELEKHEQVQALVRLAIGSGQAVNVPKEITGRILDHMRNAKTALPEGAPLGTIERIEPIEGQTDEVLLTFRSIDGAAIQATMPLSMFLGLRAFYSPILRGVFGARLFLGHQAANTIAGEVWHESIHYRWNTLDVGLRDRLVGHSATLGVLDMQMGTYLSTIGDPTATYAQDTTIRAAYEERYAGRANFEDIMQQESVAHLVELASHGYFTEAELAPIAADLAAIDGRASASVSDDLLAAISGSDMKGSGFTLFPLTDRVKRSVMEEGQALFALGGSKKYERRLEVPYAWSRVTKARAQQLIAELKERIESLESGKERQMGSYSVSDLANHFRENLRGIEAVLPKFDMPTEALRKPFKPSKIVEAGENFVARVATDERHKDRAWTGDITYYLHRKPTEAVSKSGRLFGENATAKDLGPELGKVGLYKHSDGRWEVGMVEVKQKYRRMGVASALYDAIEEDMGIKMQPSGTLLPDGYRYWSKRDPDSTRFHQKVYLYGNDLYLSPKRIMKDLAATELNLSSIRNRLALLEKDGPSPTQSYHDWGRELRDLRSVVASYERQRDTYMAALDAVPADGKTQEALDAMFALSGYRQGRTVTEPDALYFWQRPPKSGDVLMFHGTRRTFDKFDMAYSRDFGVHFGTAEQANERLVITDMEGARTIPVEITLKNAIVMQDPGFWGPTEVADGLMRAGYQVSKAEYDRFQRLAAAIDKAANGDNPKITRAAVGAANQAIAEKLNALGIDGIWYRNKYEGGGWSLTVWNKGQVRSATSNDVLMAMRPSIANRPLPDGQHRIAKPGTAEPIKPLSQLVADLNQALGLTTRIGRLNPGLKAQAGAAGGKLRGQYNTATDVTRLSIPLDIETLSHEGGHALEERFGVPLRVLMEANAKELEKLATPGSDQLSEGFAEFIRRYVTNPTMAEARAPKFFKAFEQFVNKAEPLLLKRLHEVTTGYQDWINAPSGGAVLSTIKTAKKDKLIAELTKHSRKNGFRNVAVDYFHKAYTGLIDGLHPVKMATDKLIEIASVNLATPLGDRNKVGLIAARDPYKLLRLARNAYQGGHVDLMRGVRDYHTHEHKGPSLHDAIGVAMGGFESSQWSDENIKAFGAYLISRRMVAEWNRFKAGELEGMPDKLSQADHIQAQKDFEQQFPQFIDAADMVYAYQKNLLRKAKDAGFVSEETYDDLIKRTDYVPAHRDMSEDAEETVSGAGAKVSGSNKARLLKQFRGSTRDIINPLETIAKTTYEWNFIIARNDAIRALDRLARAVGPGGGKIAERIPSSQMSGTQVNAIEIVKRAGKQAGMDEADLLFLTNSLEEQLGDDADTVIFRPGEMTEGGEPIVYLWEGGKRVAIRLADGAFGKEMYEAFTGLGRESMNVIAEFFAKPSQWLRAGVTLDPAFVAANWMRDNPSAWIVSGDHGTLLPRFDRSAKASMDALRAAFGANVEDLDVLASTGGMVGGAGIESLNASRVERDIKALQKKGIRIRDALPYKKQFWELTGVTETGTRLSVFRAARERALRDGLDEYEATVEAAYTANDLIDFGRFGSKMLVARRMFTFLNAFIQGIDKAARTATGGSETGRAVQDVISPYVRQADGQVLTVLERQAVPIAAQMFAKMAAIGFIGFALSMIYKDDPDYEEIPEYFRNTHWVFKDQTGTWRRVPKPFELGAMSLVMERSFEAYYKGDTQAMKRLVLGLGDLVAPPHVVPGVQVAYEAWANKSAFTGGPIVPPNLEKLPGELQFTAYTSEFSKMFAQITGLSAAKIDHVIAGTTGSFGKSLLDKSNIAMPTVGMFLRDHGMPTLGFPTTPRPEQRDVDRIFIRRFTVDPARSSQSKKEFWKEMSQTNGEMSVKAAGYKEFFDRAQFDEAAETLKRMKEHERVYALVEGHGTSRDKRDHPMNRAKSVLEVTNGIRRDLDTGKLKDDKGNAYSPSDRRVIQEIVESIQMREARNAQVVLGLPGFTHLKILPTEPVLRELEAKVPSIFEELEFRLRKARVSEFDDVREGYADLKARVLEPDFVQDNQPRRKVGRRAP